MVTAEIWSNRSGVWYGVLAHPPIAVDGFVFMADSRGGIIAKMRRDLPLSHLQFFDRMDPTDP